jgi:serine/threonine protein kinase/Leucine-rich repeat (LRR) protein
MSTAALLDVLRRSRLLEPGPLAEAERQARGPQELLAWLVQRGWLTPYQAEQLAQDDGDELLLGSYVLLEKLGEGGMGAVFKARNWKLGKTVALKLIRKEKLTHPEAFKRFQREIRVAAQLDHPNVVHAYDADEADGTCFFVMEHVEGTDLHQRVRQRGPLPVLRACEYVRQAALGLQHAHEHGLVHRDIKPHNLLLTERVGAGPQVHGPLVKVADLGLARVRASEDGNSNTPLTEQGLLLGTCDYLAPEQAADAHGVDIRADLYSLGCTLYFLISGRVPFPGKSIPIKLILHRDAEPVPLEQLRADVPPEVAAVVRKLMAKGPKDRFQTPAELATVLAGILRSFEAETVVATPTVQETRPASTPETPFADLNCSTPGGVIIRPQRPAQGRRWPAAVLAAVLGLTTLGLVLALRPRSTPTDEPEKTPTRQEKRPGREPFEQWKARVQVLPAPQQVEAVAARLKEYNPGFDGQLTPRIEHDVVTELVLLTDHVTDLSPVAALSGLRVLSCCGSDSGKGRLADLEPLRGLKLTSLDCRFNRVADLEPLHGMPLRWLACCKTRVASLEPLRGGSLTYLDCHNTAVKDLGPLRGLPLTILQCDSTKIHDLWPLKGMKLEELHFRSTGVDDLSPLAGMPLSILSFSATPVDDLSPLHDLPLTQLYCSGTPIADLSPLSGMGLVRFDCHTTWVSDLAPIANPWLKELLCHSTLVSDLSPLEGTTSLTKFSCENTLVRDLSPLRKAPLQLLDFSRTPVERLPSFERKELTTLYCYRTPLSDLSPLEGMPLTYLHCGNTRVSDLTPLRASRALRILEVSGSPVKSLTPLRGLPLEEVGCQSTSVSDLTPLAGLPLRELRCDFRPERDGGVLRRLRGLRRINDEPAERFWAKQGWPAAGKQ